MNRLNLSFLLLVLSLSIKIVDSRFLDPRFAAVDLQNKKSGNVEVEFSGNDVRKSDDNVIVDWDLIFAPLFDVTKYNYSETKIDLYILRLHNMVTTFLEERGHPSLYGRIFIPQFPDIYSSECETADSDTESCMNHINKQSISVTKNTNFSESFQSSYRGLEAKWKLMYVLTNIPCSDIGTYNDLSTVLSSTEIDIALMKYLDQVVVFFIPDGEIDDAQGPCENGQCPANLQCVSNECVIPSTSAYPYYAVKNREVYAETSTAAYCYLDDCKNQNFATQPLLAAMWSNVTSTYAPSSSYCSKFGCPQLYSAQSTAGDYSTASSAATTTTTDGTDANKPLLYSIIAICATVIVLALCCGCICLIKMKYRFSSLRLNFYARNVFRRNGSPSNAAAINDYGAAPKIGSQLEFVYDKWEINFNDLAINKNEKLGSGAFAAVYKGYLKGKNPLLENYGNLHFALEMAENSGNQVAVKMLHAHADDSNREELKKEIEFMKTLGYHPHILNMIGCVSSIYDPLLIVEYCANGDLLTLLRKNKDYIMMDPDEDCPAQADFCLTLRDLLSFAWQVSDGMVYMSSKNFIHRDVAARNILITKRMVAKVADFGLCRYTQENLYTTKGGKLPIKWMAIESLKLADYTSKSDVWAYGVFLFELFSAGDSPYPGIQPSEMTEYLLEGHRLEKPALCPDEIYKMMKEMWEPNPELRPSFEEIRQRLSGCLEISSDSYGYIQVSADYNRLYSLVDPRKVSKASANAVRRLTATAPESETGLELREIRANSSFQTPTAPVPEGSDLSDLDEVDV